MEALGPDTVDSDAVECGGFDSSDLLKIIKPGSGYLTTLAQSQNSDYTLVQVPSDSISAHDEAQLELAVEDDGVAEGGEDDGPLVSEADREISADERAYMYITGASSSMAQRVAAKRRAVQNVNHAMSDQMPADIADAAAAESTDAAVLQTSESVDGSSALFPLGSSQNPIRIIQQGNKYTSTQQLSPEQLSQIMQVIQQQQLLNSNKPSSILYNPETQTKIVYRVVYPSDQYQSKGKAGVTGRKMGHLRQRAADNDLDSDGSDSEQRFLKEERKKQPQRTRSGRKCRPPQYMVKDYKHIHPIDYDVEDNVNSDGGYSDFQESSDDGEKLSNVAVEEDEESRLSKNSVESPVEYASSGKPKSFKCTVCHKCYVGRGGLARHFRLQPTHGQIEDLPPVSADATNSNDSIQSSSMNSSSAPSGHAVTAGESNAATTFSGIIKQNDSAEELAAADPVTPAASTASTSLVEDKLADPSDEASGHQDTFVDPNETRGDSRPSLSGSNPPSSQKRRRGRPPASLELQSERRKEKLREVMMQCSSEEIADVILPSLASSFSIWQYLVLYTGCKSSTAADAIENANAARRSSTNVDLAAVLDEFVKLHSEVQKMCTDELEIVSGETVGATTSSESVLTDNSGHESGGVLNSCPDSLQLNMSAIKSCVTDPASDPIEAQETDGHKIPDACSANNVTVADTIESLPANSENTSECNTFNSESTCQTTGTASDVDSLSKPGENLQLTESVNGIADTALHSSDVTNAVDINGELAENVQRTGSVCSAAAADTVSELENSQDDKSAARTNVVEQQSVVISENDKLKISCEELAHCLGLDKTSWYVVKPQLPSSKDTSLSTEMFDDIENSTGSYESSVLSQVDQSRKQPIGRMSLPPRKRLKLQQFTGNYDPYPVGIVANRSSVAKDHGVENIGEACTNTSTTISSALGVDNSLSNGTYFSVSNQLLSGLTNDEMLGDVIVPASQALFAQPVSVPISIVNRPRQQVTTKLPGQSNRVASRRGGRKPQQMMSILRPDLLQRPHQLQPQQQQQSLFVQADDKTVLNALLSEQQMIADESVDSCGVDTSAGNFVPVMLYGSGANNSAVVATATTTPMPNVIHIDPNAKVMQTDDGLIIVCNPDGTIQVHGHTEGQAIPLEAVRALLGVDDVQQQQQQTTVSYDGGDAVTSNMACSSQQSTVLNLNVGQTLIPVDGNVAASTALFGVDGSSLVAFNGAQSYSTMDGSTAGDINKALMSIDGSNCQTLVAIDGSATGHLPLTTLVDGQTLLGLDPSQAATLMTLENGQAIMTLGGGQTLVTMDCMPSALVGLEGGQVNLQSTQSIM